MLEKYEESLKAKVRALPRKPGVYLMKDRLGSIIYVDCNRSTSFFPSISLYDICRQAQGYAEDKRALYINGVDYTDDVMAICFASLDNSGELEGFMPVTQEIYELLRTITMSEKYAGIHNSWLMLCYYYVTICAEA